jgi:RimJ/RimL family protein N-acetyltransferase
MFALTQRLLLRPGWAEDGPALARAIGEEAIVRNLAQVPWPYTIDHARQFLGRERRPGEISLLIVLRSGGDPIGSVGIHPTPDGGRVLGYWLARPFWGRGIATEAGRAAIVLARDALRLRRIEASCFVDNPASRRVLDKLGFRPAGPVVPRFSAGRGGEAQCALLALDLEGDAEGLTGAAMAA